VNPWRLDPAERDREGSREQGGSGVEEAGEPTDEELEPGPAGDPREDAEGRRPDKEAPERG
jgi:hypothetical protein